MSPPDKSAYLSKSLYTRGLQCHKSLYLYKYQPELRANRHRSSRRYGKAVTRSAISPTCCSPGSERPLRRTDEGRTAGEDPRGVDRGTKAIYEATFSYDDVFVKADILVRNRGYWDLYEVKSSTSVKEHYWTTSRSSITSSPDAGSPSTRRISCTSTTATCGMGHRPGGTVRRPGHHRNREREGRRPSRMRWRDAGDAAGRMPEIDIGPTAVTRTIATSWTTAGSTSPSIPSSPCGAWDRPVELYRQGVIKLQDVPLDSLNLMQRMQTEYFLDRKSHADPPKIGSSSEGAVSGCFLDFETFGSAIRCSTGPGRTSRCRSNTPSPHRRGREEARHFEYCGTGVDPRKEIAEKLPGEIPSVRA